MKRSYWLVLAALCLTTTALRAQSGPTPVSGATYTYVTSFNASHVVTECPEQATAKQKEEYHWTVCVWLTGTGAVELSIGAATFTVDDDCNTIDNTTTDAIFSLLGTESVRKAAALGHLTASTNCGSPSQTTVTVNSCVTRHGSGSSTSFAASGSALSRRDYSFCTSGGSTMVTLTGVSGSTSCGSGSESTCGSGGNLQ